MYANYLEGNVIEYVHPDC